MIFFTEYIILEILLHLKNVINSYKMFRVHKYIRNLH